MELYHNCLLSQGGFKIRWLFKIDMLLFLQKEFNYEIAKDKIIFKIPLD